MPTTDDEGAKEPSTREPASQETSGDGPAVEADHDEWIPIQSVSQGVSEPGSPTASPDDVIFDLVGADVHDSSGGGGAGTEPPPPPPPPPPPAHDDDTMEGMDAEPQLTAGAEQDATAAWELENARVTSYSISGAGEGASGDEPVVIGAVPNGDEPPPVDGTDSPGPNEPFEVLSFDMGVENSTDAAGDDKKLPVDVIRWEVGVDAPDGATEQFFTVEVDEGPVALTELQPDGVMAERGVADTTAPIHPDADLLFGGDEPFDDI